jgi:CHAP domain
MSHRAHRLLFATALAAAGCGPALTEDPGDDAVENPWAGDYREATATPPPACGQAIGSFNGTDARSNAACTGGLCSCAGSVQYGLGYQCVELVNRYWVSHGLGARVYGNAGLTACHNAANMADYVVHWPGDATAPAPGDALEWVNTSNTNYGHVALVTHNANGAITFLQQNAGTKSSYYPHGTVSWTGHTFGWYGGSLKPACWIHPKKAGSTPPPSAAGCFSSTLNAKVASGVCVQAASDGQWYHCANGSWLAGETNCTTSYPFCHSATLGRYVPARTCVHSKYDGIEYQCTAHATWATPVKDGAGPIGTCSAMYN